MMNLYPFLDYIKGNGRNGKGGAIKRAVNIALGEFVMLMDADGSISLADLTKSLNFIDFYDVIIFNRYSRAENEMPFMRRFVSRGFNMLVRGFLGIRITDTQCGYKIIKTEYAREAFSKISVSDTFFDVALFYYLNKHGAKSVEIPFKYRHGGESKFNVVGEVLGQGTSSIAFPR
jgi:glycosyltransferase involved in cell wall biosynthesis